MSSPTSPPSASRDRARDRLWLYPPGRGDRPGVARVERFVEKPDIVTAAEAMAQARHEAAGSGARVFPEPRAFGRSPNESIDYAAMEKADRLAVVPVGMGWSDVGSWDALHELADKDEGGNAHYGEVVAIDTSNCLIRSEGPLVAAVGVHDLIVIATGDAVLILRAATASRSSAPSRPSAATDTSPSISRGRKPTLSGAISASAFPPSSRLAGLLVASLFPDAVSVERTMR